MVGGWFVMIEFVIDGWLFVGFVPLLVGWCWLVD